ncbi:MAG TPA: GspE/PulE family protein [Pantanalinema sp.]
MDQAAASSGTGGLRKKMIGEWLCNLGLISPFQLSEALSTQQESGERIGQILIQKGYLNERELSEILTLQEVLATKSSLLDFPIEAETIALIPEAFARKNLLVPLMKVGRRLIIATRNIDDPKLLDHLSLLTGYIVVPIGFREEDLSAALGRFYEDRSRRVDDTIERAIKRTGAGRDDGRRQQAQDISASTEVDAPIVELVNSILTDAVERGAADIAFDPTEDGLAIRMRSDGVMTTVLKLPRAIEASVITRIKVMAGMNITEKRRPQDGRFSVVVNGEKIDFRTSCIATHWGERISMRILRTRSILHGLDNLGFSQRDRDTLEQILLSPIGVILVTGPTGSGKTTTLYAVLQQFDRESDSIITIEDPVEYPVPGIAQIQVNPKIDLNFSSALRTVLRQDPDVIMVGEIRDLETLETATSAAMTGHLVLSTLHTNDAVSTVTRMIEMGIPPYVVGGTVSGIVAQRLIRCVCSACKTTRSATVKEKAFLNVPVEEELTLAVGTGCERCNGTGYKGQLGVFEILRITRPIQSLISRGEPSTVIQDEANRLGMNSLLDDAKEKVLKGLSTVDEVIRCLGTGTN